MPKIYGNIAATLDGADDIVKNLLAEYDRSLSTKSVSAKAINLTHQACTELMSWTASPIDVGIA